ncbi:unnamed protein product [Tetraodon nigroviridis]|uniref:(spotted green pufferfish) hypothetical protein n=1 Tax=Tetraodon nigroviridis TaxID=99883 RepID=Q4SXE1_TETNG|nr:unnamed protein product [Tetraodon nigroviridis]
MRRHEASPRGPMASGGRFSPGRLRKNRWTGPPGLGVSLIRAQVTGCERCCGPGERERKRKRKQVLRAPGEPGSESERSWSCCLVP